MKIWENLDEKDVFFFGLFRLHLISSVVIKYGTEGCDPHGYSCSVPVSHEVSSTTFAWLRSIFGSVLHWLHQHLRLHLTHLQHLLVWLDHDWVSVSWWHLRWVDLPGGAFRDELSFEGCSPGFLHNLCRRGERCRMFWKAHPQRLRLFDPLSNSHNVHIGRDQACSTDFLLSMRRTGELVIDIEIPGIRRNLSAMSQHYRFFPQVDCICYLKIWWTSYRRPIPDDGFWIISWWKCLKNGG